MHVKASEAVRCVCISTRRQSVPKDPSAIHLNMPCCVLVYKHTAYLCMHEFMTAVAPLSHKTNGTKRK